MVAINLHHPECCSHRPCLEGLPGANRRSWTARKELSRPASLEKCLRRSWKQKTSSESSQRHHRGLLYSMSGLGEKSFHLTSAPPSLLCVFSEPCAYLFLGEEGSWRPPPGTAEDPSGNFPLRSPRTLSSKSSPSGHIASSSSSPASLSSPGNRFLFLLLAGKSPTGGELSAAGRLLLLPVTTPISVVVLRGEHRNNDDGSEGDGNDGGNDGSNNKVFSSSAWFRLFCSSFVGGGGGITLPPGEEGLSWSHVSFCLTFWKWNRGCSRGDLFNLLMSKESRQECHNAASLGNSSFGAALG